MFRYNAPSLRGEPRRPTLFSLPTQHFSMTNSPSGNRRITCFVSGRVQGVGFRAQTKGVARKFDVSGTVQNLPDGRVKIVVEGRLDEIQTFLKSVSQPTSGRVSKLECYESEASGEFDGFETVW